MNTSAFAETSHTAAEPKPLKTSSGVASPRTSTSAKKPRPTRKAGRMLALQKASGGFCHDLQPKHRTWKRFELTYSDDIVAATNFAVVALAYSLPGGKRASM